MRSLRVVTGLLAGALLAGCLERPAVRAEGLDGIWNLDPAACAEPASDTRLTITGDDLQFHESRCRTGHAVLGPDAISTTMDCRGEGQDFSRSVVLRRMGDLLELAEDGIVLRYHLCRAE